jgi:hypothetical protein
MQKDVHAFLAALGITTIVFSSFSASVAFAALSCTVTTAGGCSGSVIWRMSGATNAHAELPSQSNSAYDTNVVCCSGVSGLGNSCSGSFATVLKFAATTNSHVQQSTVNTYANNACISAPSGSFTVGYQATNCSDYDTTLGSMASSDNSHVGDTTAYTTKICASYSATSLTFTVTNQGFANTSTSITPGVAAMATSTLSVTTSNATGWNVTLSGDNKSATNNNLQRTGETAIQINDQTEWIPGSATTSAGNAVRISSFTNSGNVLAFRVMTASSTNGVSFISSTWWGSGDNFATDNAVTVFAGIASSTISRQIGNAGSGSLSGSAHLNDVQYYLKTAVTQKTGAYTAALTYTATANP